MRTTTIEEQLARARRRIDLLHAAARAGTSELQRIGFHLEALRRVEAGVRAAALDAPEEVEERLVLLTTRIDVTEKSLAADASDEWPTFSAAVTAELASWDTYLERLQATAAAKGGDARTRVEAAIADVRSQRIAVDDRLARARANVADAWHAQRSQVCAARDELERKAAELSATLR